MQRVHDAALDRAPRGHQRLAGHLSAEHPLAILLRAAAAEDVHLELLEVEDLDQLADRVRHAPRCGTVTLLLHTGARGVTTVGMRAAVMRNRQLVVDTVPDPEPGPGEVLVRTLACGICGSDLHALTHADKMVEAARETGAPFGIDPSRDVVMGHEFCAEVIDYGPDTAGNAKPGERVVSMPLLFRGDDTARRSATRTRSRAATAS